MEPDRRHSTRSPSSLTRVQPDLSSPSRDTPPRGLSQEFVGSLSTHSQADRLKLWRGGDDKSVSPLLILSSQILTSPPVKKGAQVQQLYSHPYLNGQMEITKEHIINGERPLLSKQTLERQLKQAAINNQHVSVINVNEQQSLLESPYRTAKGTGGERAKSSQILGSERGGQSIEEIATHAKTPELVQKRISDLSAQKFLQNKLAQSQKSRGLNQQHIDEVLDLQKKIQKQVRNSAESGEIKAQHGTPLPPRTYKSTSNTARRSIVQSEEGGGAQRMQEEQSGQRESRCSENQIEGDLTDRVLTAQPPSQQTVIVPLLPTKRLAQKKKASLKRGGSQMGVSEQQRRSNPAMVTGQINAKSLLKKQKSKSQKEFASPYYKNNTEKMRVPSGTKKAPDSGKPTKLASAHKHTSSHKTLRNCGEMVLQKDPPLKESNYPRGSALFFGKERSRDIPPNKSPIRSRYVTLANSRNSRGRSPISARESEPMDGFTGQLILRPRTANSSSSPNKMSKLLFQTVGGTMEHNSIIDNSDPQDSMHLLQSNIIMSMGGEEFERDRPATSSHSERERRGSSIEMSTTSTKYKDNLGNVYEVVHQLPEPKSASESPQKASPQINIRFLHKNDAIGKTLQKAIKFIGIRGGAGSSTAGAARIDDRIIQGPSRAGVNMSSPFNLPACFPQMLPHQHLKQNLMQLHHGGMTMHSGFPGQTQVIVPLPQEQQRRLGQSSTSFSKHLRVIHDKECYKFYVGKGNNSKVVRDAMLRREWWEEVPQGFSTLYNFKWMPVSQQFNYNNLQNRSVRSLINHFENHHEITRKSNLFSNMLMWTESSLCTQMINQAGVLTPRKENIFKIVPVTFSFSLDSGRMHNPEYMNQVIQPFLNFYNILEDNKHKAIREPSIIPELLTKRATNSSPGKTANSPEKEKGNQLTKIYSGASNLQSVNNSFSSAPRYLQPNPRNQNNYQQTYILPHSHFVGHNLWILKPTSFNRGQGIHVFRDLDKLRELLHSYLRGPIMHKSGKNEGSSPGRRNKGDLRKAGSTTSILSEIVEERGEGTTGIELEEEKKNTNKNVPHFNVRTSHFIIQKYIETPLLLRKRKFDIRVWVLLNQNSDLFFFKEGYLRTSGSAFEINENNVDDQFVHLTNNAVQKFSQSYGEHEEGNTLSFSQFQEIIDQEQGERFPPCDVREHILPQMKQLVIKTFQSIRRKMNPRNEKFMFELFGYDFILDVDFNVWLIECNTNPCLELNAKWLEIIIPRMIEDMLRLTVDLSFPRLKMKNIKKNEHKDGNLETERQTGKASRTHPVPGYSDSENMWEKLVNLTDKIPHQPIKEIRSEEIISVGADKMFRIKKNPYYQQLVKQHSEQSKVEEGGIAGAESGEAKEEKEEEVGGSEDEKSPVTPDLLGDFPNEETTLKSEFDEK